MLFPAELVIFDSSIKGWNNYGYTRQLWWDEPPCGVLTATGKTIAFCSVVLEGRDSPDFEAVGRGYPLVNIQKAIENGHL